MDTLRKQLCSLFLQVQEGVEQMTEHQASVGVPEYVPSLGVVSGYLVNEDDEKLTIFFSPEDPTVHVVIGHKSGNSIKHRCQFPSLDGLKWSDIYELYSKYLIKK